MKVLSVSSELYPLIKTGGLADVAGALPLAMAAHGVETRSLLPGYPQVMQKIENPKVVLEFDNLLGEPAQLLEVTHQGLDLLILDAPAYFDRPAGPYLDAAGLDYSDNWRRFAALSRAAADIAAGALEGWQPDLVHAHDWQAAMTPVYMRYDLTPELPSLLTVHNIAFQGQFSSQVFAVLGLPPHAFWETMEYYGDINFLKSGLLTATAITTVSPSYAEEILTPEFGMGMQGVIADRLSALHGIVNGIDAKIWNPDTDPMLTANYSAATLKRRALNRRAVAEHFHLDDDDGPIFCVVSRLTFQKGMDLLAEAVDEIVERGGKLAVLGSGDAELEMALLHAAARHPGRVGMVMGYNEPLSHLMQGGADAILIPSRFEPCGLTQLYGLRYGCVPVVARNGGLNDTVIDANHAALAGNVATGIQFSTVTLDGFLQALRRTFRLFETPKLWTQIQKQGMKSDVSWDKSGERYAALYSSLLSKGHPHP